MVVSREREVGPAMREARRRLRSTADPHAFAFVCRHPLAGPAVTCIVTRSVEIVVTGRAATLLQMLALAHTGPDGRLHWASLGNLLPHIDVSGPGLMNRRTLVALVRGLKRDLGTDGVATLLQAHHAHGLRLRARPVAMIWFNAEPWPLGPADRRRVDPVPARHVAPAAALHAHR